MLIETLVILANLILFMVVIYSYSRHGVLDLLPSLFPKGSINNRAKTRWIAFAVEQSEKPNMIFLSSTKLGFSEQGLFVRYIFPFSLFMRGFDIPVNKICFLTSKKKYGILFKVLKIEGIDSGYLMLPIFFLSGACKPNVTWWPRD